MDIILYLILALGVCLGLLIMDILICVSVYGRPPRDKETCAWLAEYQHTAWINSLNRKIICFRHRYFISSPRSKNPLYKYYINNMGVIPRWYRAHKLIKQLYSDLESQQYTEGEKSR